MLFTSAENKFGFTLRLIRPIQSIAAHNFLSFYRDDLSLFHHRIKTINPVISEQVKLYFMRFQLYIKRCKIITNYCYLQITITTSQKITAYPICLCSQHRKLSTQQSKLKQQDKISRLQNINDYKVAIYQIFYQSMLRKAG